MAAVEFGYTIEERQVAVEEIFDGEEAFCSGTAAVITPILSMTYRDRKMEFCGGEVGPKTMELYEGLTSIQWEQREDPYDWLDIIQ